MIVLVDPGHGGPYPGAVAGGVKESDINLAVALLLRRALTAASPFIRCLLTRDADYALVTTNHIHDINQRAALARTYRADALVSLHCNAAVNTQARGMEVFTSVGQNNSDILADRIIEELKWALPERRFREDLSDGDGDKEVNFNILIKPPCPAVLVEMGFISNDEERAWLLDETTQQGLADAIARGVARFGGCGR